MPFLTLPWVGVIAVSILVPVAAITYFGKWSVRQRRYILLDQMRTEAEQRRNDRTAKP